MHPQHAGASATANSGANAGSQLWSEKHRPTNTDTMCHPVWAKKLKHWLKSWEALLPAGPPASTSAAPGSIRRAVMLSGPPGVGKTTSVYAVARELDYDVIEFNASDHRSARSLRETVGDLVNNRIFRAPPATSAAAQKQPQQKIPAIFQTQQQQQQQQPQQTMMNMDMKRKFVLLMDEVDGVDRGGTGEVIQLIKSSRCPIICTCNDRWHQKLRSLVGYCDDYRFTRPPSEVIATYLMEKVLPLEGVTVPQNTLEDVIKESGNDIRSVLNNLQVWTVTNKRMTQQGLTAASVTATKNVELSIFDAAEKFFAPAPPPPPPPPPRGQQQQQPVSSSPMSVEEQMTLYYNSDLIDLFVQENYLHYRPDRKDWLKSVAVAANSISAADVMSRAIFAEQSWGMGGAAAFKAAVYPCAAVRGNYTSFVTGYDKKGVKFPAWLGNNSTATKNTRVATCIVKQGQDPTSGFGVGCASEFAMDYAPVLAPRLAEPVARDGKDGIAEAITVMDQYHLMREDWDALNELVEFKKQVEVQNTSAALQSLGMGVAAQTKAALTREFNKTAHADRGAGARLASKAVTETQQVLGGGDDDDDDDFEDGGAPASPKGGGAAGGKKKGGAAAAAAAAAEDGFKVVKPKAKRAPAKASGKKAAAAAAAATAAGGAGGAIDVDEDDDAPAAPAARAPATGRGGKKATPKPAAKQQQQQQQTLNGVRRQRMSDG